MIHGPPEGAWSAQPSPGEGYEARGPQDAFRSSQHSLHSFPKWISWEELRFAPIANNPQISGALQPRFISLLTLHAHLGLAGIVGVGWDLHWDPRKRSLYCRGQEYDMAALTRVTYLEHGPLFKRLFKKIVHLTGRSK